jgi:hypothetical protein
MARDFSEVLQIYQGFLKSKIARPVREEFSLDESSGSDML